MLFRSSMAVTPSLTRNHSLFTFITKIPSLLVGYRSQVHCHLLNCPSHKLLNRDSTTSYMNKSIRHCSTALSAITPAHESSKTTNVAISNKSRRKAYRDSAEGKLRHELDMCSKRGDLAEALRLYDDARSKAIPLREHHYNVLLYLCSSSQSKVESHSGVENENSLNLGLKRGLEIFQQMGIDKIAPNEATFTSVARLAVAMEDPDLAFDMVRRMMSCDIPPRLRSYGPALFGFCKKGEADKAYEVDAHMASSGVSPEEPELAALLGLSVDVARGDRVYEMLHRLRSTVRQVSESTAETVERWFNSDAAADVGKENWDANKVKEGIAKGGGGWHGQGWLGKGTWKVERAEMDETGVCRTCGERLVCIDIDPLETENFASSLSSLACKREVKADFNGFQEWLRRRDPYDAIIDGANVGLVNQHDFSFLQLNSVVNEMRERSPSKRIPLIVLHHRRVHGGPAENPRNKKLIQAWKKAGALYATPAGSNDDWYWLYAAVSCNCLLVTNDEMRDHLFQLLGTNFFPRWKEKHQVRLTMSRRGTTLHMPPPYSIVIQESERGSWHVPIVTDDDIETPRKWVCATRAQTNTLSSQ